MKIAPAAPAALAPCPQLPSAGIAPGVFPYLGGSVSLDRLRSAVSDYGGAMVSGKPGARLAACTPGVLIDPATYAPQARTGQEALFDYDDWLVRQRATGVPLILTDTPRIRNDDWSALRKALARWDMINEPTLVVLPIEPWWLRDGLPGLIEEVRSAGRPVAIVLLHRFNGLDPKAAVAGLLRLVSSVRPLPVVLLRSDISAVGAVAHRAFAGFVGWSNNSRHGPLPMRRAEDDERDDAPSVFVPALTDYVKTSKLPVFARIGRLDVLRCDDSVCLGESLLRIAQACETDLRNGRLLASTHNLASTEQLASRVLAAADPPGAWRTACAEGAKMTGSLAESGVSLPLSRWLRQWIELGSPAQDYRPVG